jgi:hypothetical protein
VFPQAGAHLLRLGVGQAGSAGQQGRRGQGKCNLVHGNDLTGLARHTDVGTCQYRHALPGCQVLNRRETGALTAH